MKSPTIPLLLAALIGLAPSLALAAKAPARTKSKAAIAKVRDDPQPDAGALIAQSRLAATQGQPELAERLAQAAIVAAPAQPKAYIALGDVYAGAGQRDYARSYYEQALAIDPQEPAALKALAALGQRSAQNLP
jgi:Flp pilus assembly protein TadD